MSHEAQGGLFLVHFSYWKNGATHCIGKKSGVGTKGLWRVFAEIFLAETFLLIDKMYVAWWQLAGSQGYNSYAKIK